MAVNMKCPKCGSTMVQMTTESKSHGCLWTFLFGIVYIIYVMMKWMIGLLILICFDWWMAIIKHACGKGYVWRCRRWFSGRRRLYYCHNCGYNFKT